MKFEYVTCNVCGSDDVKKVGRRISPDADPLLDTDIGQCVRCGLIYPNPMPRFTAEEIQNNFSDPENYFSEAITPARIKRYEKALARIEKFYPGKGNLLDVGCGRGEFLYAASKMGWRATGTDVSKSFSDFAKKKFGITVMIGDISDLNLPSENFDAICLNSVIQYIPDPMRSLKTVYKLLKAKGILYIEATNEDALVFKFADFLKSASHGRRMTTHLSPLFPSFQIFGFNRKSISKALELTGFKIPSLEIKGLKGGGAVKGHGIKNLLLNIARRVIIFIGGLTGKGHLMYCIASKKV